MTDDNQNPTTPEGEQPERAADAASGETTAAQQPAETAADETTADESTAAETAFDAPPAPEAPAAPEASGFAASDAEAPDASPSPEAVGSAPAEPSFDAPAPEFGAPQPGYQQAPPPGAPQPGYPQPGYQQAPPPGYPQPGYQQAPPPGYVPYDPQAKSRMAAGLLGIFLGSLGIHRFYLGYTGIGVAMLLISVLSLGFLSWAVAIWGLVEGILILTRSQSFLTDSTGRPLRD